VQWLTSVIPATEEIDIAGLQFEASQSKKFISTNKLGAVACICHPSCAENVNRRILF
jgi:hypothetical protein